ncbi:MAG: NAD(P)-dependent alcohol dehydrogenase [Mycobacterium sp.]|uniref:zinc-dependent alcohol dehydrogenase family protein n=1 Tax=Mycobacterium sp. TaxID=1785 RepID=UPI000CC9511F|nr:NAD(P)-dependent alcohol dehydrogenase [Mycobacterium sp.]PJE01098.1 MAG: NAD(P)-dependent alcohol dehydrogenase [Mycobacterium sp.]PJE02102.1 MAG: NAD(P)-dependent alcohol dehydrogenase [Mycobacterium sp.]PJE21753.1 MAG: NAD(P)-dependent alcohol dehydrogenase [Mycobacterium sp.]
MRAYEIAPGSTGIDGVALVERPDPVPGPYEILVRVRAASINYRDLGVISGRYFTGPVMRPTVPFSDGAGEVIDVGPKVERFAIGDAVCGCFFRDWFGGPLTDRIFQHQLGGGLDGVLAEQVVLPESGAVVKPDHLTFEEAATLPCAAVTAWNAVIHTGATRPGDTVLVLGTGGVSLFALQFAKLAGARVIVTSSSDDKLARAETLGADVLVNYRKSPEWQEEVLEHTGGHGVDLVVEVGGAGTLPRSLQAVKTAGQVAVIGVVAGGGSIDPLPLIPKALRLQGIYVGSRDMFEDMNAAMTQHRLRPVIDEVLAFDDALDAYRALPQGNHFGKIVVNVSEP